MAERLSEDLSVKMLLLEVDPDTARSGATCRSGAARPWGLKDQLMLHTDPDPKMNGRQLNCWCAWRS
ncbi:MAG: hypothetical protein ABI642_00590 [Polaromonas sp.]